MRDEDTSAVSSILISAREIGFSPNRIALLSGSPEEGELMSVIYPRASVVFLDKSHWDLDNSYSDAWGVFDLAIACNTFMCSSDPQRWIQNISGAASYLLIQDLSIVQRCPDRYLSPETGDVARYSITSYGIIGKTDPGYQVSDLSLMRYNIIDCRSYGIKGQECVKFVALLDLSRKMNKDA